MIHLPLPRPMPPSNLCEMAEREVAPGLFVPAPELDKWARATFLTPSSPLCNPEHSHLAFADIGWLWTNVPNQKGGNDIAGEAWCPHLKGAPWVKAKAEYQLMQWFGGVPDFVITVFAPYAEITSDLAWCALIEHEMYHCGQALDRDGMPAYKEDGSPKYRLRSHDVEEFVGVVERYGVEGGAGRTKALVRAALQEPKIGTAQIEFCCGNCPAPLRMVA